jgi:hypothetical protein
MREDTRKAFFHFLGFNHVFDVGDAENGSEADRSVLVRLTAARDLRQLDGFEWFLQRARQAES